jgi:Protein of unknown function (DUF3572)
LRLKLVGHLQLKQDSAHVIALQVLAWIVADDDRLAGLLAASGLDPATLRTRASDPVVLGAVLDHLLGDEQAVIGFCDTHALPYTAPLAARSALPGGEMMHWT